MKSLSKTEKIENVLLAMMLWAEEKPESINLRNWRCGTQACFGGRLATWPEFKAQGVRRTSRGAPHIEGTAFVAYHLFGHSSLFWIHGAASDDSSLGDVTDYEIIVNRLEAQIERLTS
jgi:hypothetical protein